VADSMAKRYKIKLRGILGPDIHDEKEMVILNRIIRWTSESLEYEPDPRHVEIIIDELDLRGSKSVGTPGTKNNNESEKEEEPLEIEFHTKYRALVARANYLAQDRCDIQYAVKELARKMSSPTKADWVSLKRLGRYLVGLPRVITKFKWQSRPVAVRAFCDSDWAGCARTRRSTSGGVLYLGDHVVKTWSVTQANIALSSGEAEFCAIVKACSQALGFKALMEDLGYDGLKIECGTDSSAAIGIANRTGLGKVRHVAVHLLWIQEKVKERQITIHKVDGANNPADILTKFVAKDLLQRYLPRLHLSHREGRAASAPAVLQ
jgi:hypothetical protein